MAEFIEENEDPSRAERPSLTKVFRKFLESFSSELHVCLPAKVIRYDHKKPLVDVQPVFKREYTDGEQVDPPIIYNVPVAFPRAGNAFISLPITVGSMVMLLFSDRCLEAWLSTGALDVPSDRRKHHLSDAIAVPGLYPFSDPPGIANAKDVIIKNNKTQIRVKPNGHLQIMNESQELIKILVDYMSADISGAHHYKIAVRNRLKSFLEK